MPCNIELGMTWEPAGELMEVGGLIDIRMQRAAGAEVFPLMAAVADLQHASAV